MHDIYILIKKGHFIYTYTKNVNEIYNLLNYYDGVYNWNFYNLRQLNKQKLKIYLKEIRLSYINFLLLSENMKQINTIILFTTNPIYIHKLHSFLINILTFLYTYKHFLFYIPFNSQITLFHFDI